MKYSCLSRFFLALTIIIVHLSFLALILILSNFIFDSEKYNFDFLKLTRVSKNFNFTLCTVLECERKFWFVIALNGMVTLILFFEELLVSSRDIQNIFIKRANHGLIYYPKFFAKFFSHFVLSMSVMLYQPMNYFSDYTLDLSVYVRRIWFWIPFTYGLVQVMRTFSHLYIDDDELGGCLLMKLIRNEDIPLPKDYINETGIYQSIRSPFRGGVMIMLLFSNPRWDIGKLIYLGMFSFCMYAEAGNEEVYLFKKYEKYQKYVSLVKNRFFNFDFLLGEKSKVPTPADQAEKKESNENEKTSGKKKEKKN